MFAKLERQRSLFMLLCTLLVVGLAALSTGETPAALVQDASETTCEETVSLPPSDMTLATSEHSNAACRPTCVGPCWFCLLGVCENRCM
ncbi:hypothetical protein SAMN05443572_111153 [Myxococcus fulvus]|uniref:Uncharacterized protein n=1 Tax=Myxococcus fulvus TaxID=33 RepID=A0A511TGI7_MYXFU|nr:hypothetical protein [Myxococcus fulvus]GEN12773.1 hypothetical protein MFU01_78100 [Myxococcus fulvus]SEU36307.1 hypothetical protein SAMN05443572_111153 [Myxococcus fulvus]